MRHVLQGGNVLCFLHKVEKSGGPKFSLWIVRIELLHKCWIFLFHFISYFIGGILSTEKAFLTDSQQLLAHIIPLDVRFCVRTGDAHVVSQLRRLRIF